MDLRSFAEGSFLAAGWQKDPHMDRVAKTQPQREICAVCLATDGLIDTALLPCHHAFHGDCILRWVEANFSCPLCRQVIEQFLPIDADGEQILQMNLQDSISLEEANEIVATQRTKSQEIFQKFIEIWERHYLQPKSTITSDPLHHKDVIKYKPSRWSTRTPSPDISTRSPTRETPNRIPVFNSPSSRSRSRLRGSASYPSLDKLTNRKESNTIKRFNLECRHPALYMDWNPPPLSEFKKLRSPPLDRKTRDFVGTITPQSHVSDSPNQKPRSKRNSIFVPPRPRNLFESDFQYEEPCIKIEEIDIKVEEPGPKIQNISKREIIIDTPFNARREQFPRVPEVDASREIPGETLNEIHNETPCKIPSGIQIPFERSNSLLRNNGNSPLPVPMKMSSISTPMKLSTPLSTPMKLPKNSIGRISPKLTGSSHIDYSETSFLGWAVSSPRQSMVANGEKLTSFFDHQRRFRTRPKPVQPFRRGVISPPKSPSHTKVTRQLQESSLPPKLQTVNHLKAGAAAGVATALLVHAFDGNAQRFTTSVGYHGGLRGGLALFHRFPGFVSGFAPTLFAVIPTCMVYFSVYEHMKNNTFYVHDPNNHPFIQTGAHVTSAAIAASLGHMIHAPSGLIPIRYGIQFGVFELGKSIWKRAGRGRDDGDRHLGPMAIVTTSCLGGLAASSVIYPTQNILARMATASAAQLRPLSAFTGGVTMQRSTAALFSSSLASCNLKNLYKGWGPALARFLPSCVLTATAYEFALRSITR